MNQGLMRGWSAWQAKWEERVAQKQLLLAAASRLSKPLLTASLAHWRMDYEATLVSAGQRDLKRQMRALQKEAAEALKQERHSAFVTRQALHARIKELEEQIRNLFGAQVVEPAAPPPPPDPVMIVFHSISAKGIPNADAGGGSDPYARFTIIDDFTANKPGKNQIGYTSYIQNELDPNWAGERLQLDLTPGGDRPIRLRVEVWDKDVKTADDLIASAELTLSEIESGVSGKRTIRLEGDDGPPPLQLRLVGARREGGEAEDEDRRLLDRDGHRRQEAGAHGAAGPGAAEREGVAAEGEVQGVWVRD